jgi:RNA polymerase sigma factor (TIGR02999 family)
VAWSDGDESALESLMPLVYDELHRLARHYMRRERAGHVLQTTALINEAYLRLIDMNRVRWQNRAHFFAVSAQLMRRILVDFARSRDRQKRGAQLQQVSLGQALAVEGSQHTDIVKLDDALGALAEIDARKSKVVELRFFGGLSVEETSEVLKVSPETVMRDWKTAKLWLLREMSKS